MSILDQFSLNGKVIVVTGGTGILGESFVKALAEAGAKVAILGRNWDKAIERVQLVEALGGEGFAVQADVLNEEQIIQAKDLILEKWGTIDGLVNAAGGNLPNAVIGPDKNLFDVSVSDTLSAIELNLNGSIIPTHIFGQVIAEKRKGAIINIASLSSHQAITRVLGYTVAKAGIVGYTKWMATELSLRYGDGVRVNAIAPGVFLTEQNKALVTNPDGSYTERGQKFINNTPFGRLGNPSELAGALVFLLSDASSFVNGEILYVDGGFSAWSGV
ncbi:SDR family oxidoreductase [Sphingobacterium bovistauri]|uniref:SDR family oxidoreductase n=1 Tax=Sphingobacterium bovistauri TaxID=2781959 RepID=A0ABS7Z513_9SPHI|nr:SDR family oxidoreductase [Sphingobacterium bovistauri]MCA5004481.1 SDR family oxidoreductase [Sphingobacterium bovistauri]